MIREEDYRHRALFLRRASVSWTNSQNGADDPNGTSPKEELAATIFSSSSIHATRSLNDRCCLLDGAFGQAFFARPLLDYFARLALQWDDGRDTVHDPESYLARVMARWQVPAVEVEGDLQPCTTSRVAPAGSDPGGAARPCIPLLATKLGKPWDLDLPRDCAVRLEVACLACDGPSSGILGTSHPRSSFGGPTGLGRGLKRGDKRINEEHLLWECPSDLYALRQVLYETLGDRGRGIRSFCQGREAMGPTLPGAT